MRKRLQTTVKLLSSAVFASGYGIPGGEDIAACLDEQGYPYLKGSTLKGLLRESLENLLDWSGQNPEIADTLFGQDGWNGAAENRRLNFTACVLENPPEDPALCFESRTFTALEQNIIKTGSLRSALCICDGLEFHGEIECAEEDVELLKSALSGIKWAGMMRSRGFGRVQISSHAQEIDQDENKIPACSCMFYRIHTEQPVIITDLAHSGGNQYETRGYLPGSVIRGMVINALAEQNPDWFSAHKRELLSDQTRFLDAIPNPDACDAKLGTDKDLANRAILPSIRGFYQDKDEQKPLESVVIRGEFSAGFKRAKLGSFCRIQGDTIVCWSAVSGGALRLNRTDRLPFQNRYLQAGQDFDGYILLENPELAPAIAEIFSSHTLWLGADRYAGFGKCCVTRLEPVQMLPWWEYYRYQKEEEIGNELYLLAVSPLAMLDENGNLSGLHLGQLAEKLGVGNIELCFCGTSLTEFGGYNRTWQCWLPAVQMYDRGSIFHLKFDKAPKLEAIQNLQKQGLGIRRAEGFGQILCLSPMLFEKIKQKTEIENYKSAELSKKTQVLSEIRRKRLQWAMQESEKMKSFRLSKSQVGVIQELCEAAKRTGSLNELWEHLKKNREERGVYHGQDFQEISEFIQRVLETPIGKTIDMDVANQNDSIPSRLDLLCSLFNFSRKSGEGN